jgi:hypothetical protein
MLGRLCRWLVVLVSLPPALAHELTHYLAAGPVAEERRLVGLFSRRPHVGVSWRADASRLGIALAALAPLVVGIAVGVLALTWGVIAGGPLPETPRQWLIAAVGAIYYAIYTWPSAGDRRAALGGGDDV